MTRTQLIQALINKFRYKSYLEIGCRDDANYAHIHAPHKVGVDPASGGTHRMTSDDFFASNTQKFDIIFIDGLHISDQVDKDIENSLKFLNDNGCIVLHDCNPIQEEAQRDYVVISDWNGSVWKSFVKARTFEDVDAATGNFDHGCGIIRMRKNSDKISLPEGQLEYYQLEANRQKWLRLMSFNDLMNWV